MTVDRRSSAAVTRALPFGLSAMLCLPLASVSADMIDTSGMAPWEVCGMCHSLDGISAMARFPKLAGQKAGYIEQQLREFAAGNRQNDGGQMQTIAGEVEEEAISVVARYFAQLPPPAPEPVDYSADYQAGQQLFERGRDAVPACRSCHADPASEAPWLFGQHAEYLVKQLENFRSGERLNTAGPMNKLAAQLTDKELQQVATFLAASKPQKVAP